MPKEDLSKMLKELPIVKGVKTCAKDATIHEVSSLLQMHNMGSIVVVNDKDEPIGIFTERDYIKKIAINPEIDTKSEVIEKHMTPNPKCVEDSHRVDHCFGLMRVGNFRHLIVVDDKNKVKGMLSMRDAFYYLCDEMYVN